MYGNAGKGAVTTGTVVAGAQLAHTGFGLPGIAAAVLALGLIVGGLLMMRSARVARAKR